MTNMSKPFKIVLIFNLIAAVIYAVLYLFMPQTLYTLNDAPSFDLLFWRLWGGTCFSFFIMGLYALLKVDWEAFKFFFLFVILWLIITEIINFVELVEITRSATNLVSQVIDIIVIMVIIVVDIIFYLREEK